MANNPQQSPEVKKITLGIVLGWLLGIIFLLAGVSLLFTSFITGIISLLIAILLLPPANSFIANKFKFSISKGLKFVIIIILLGVMGATMPKNTNDNKAQENNNTTEASDETPQETITYTTVDMKTFLEEYDKNKLSAQEKYTDTYIQTTGYISNISSSLGSTYISLEFSKDAFLENSITCYPKSEENDKVLKLENDQKITVKGKVQDMSFMSVGLKDCEIVE